MAAATPLSVARTTDAGGGNDGISFTSTRQDGLAASQRDPDRFKGIADFHFLILLAI